MSVPGASVGTVEDRTTSDLLVPEAWVERLAAIALALPDAYQEEAWVGERWRVRGRTFAHVLAVEPGRPAAYSRAVGRDGPHIVLTFRVDPEELEAIIRSGPRYFKARWGHDVGGVVLDDAIDWDEVRELVTESYCRLAPQKLVRLVDRPPDARGR
jgi:predicted DNA-binding protein (MmcQ/YjbR family)